MTKHLILGVFLLAFACGGRAAEKPNILCIAIDEGSNAGYAASRSVTLTGKYGHATGFGRGK